MSTVGPEARGHYLVIVGDFRIRRVVGWVLDELCVEHVDVPNWRAGVAAAVRQPPALIVADWDDVGDGKGLAALLRSGWSRPIRLIILSSRPDVERAATDLGAIEGLRKPLNGSRLLATLERVSGLQER